RAHSLVPALLVLAGCSPAPAPADPANELHLLARRPDEIVQQPAAIAPQGDIPGTATWGASEGPGWAETAKTTPRGAPYLETNQATASLVLPATRPVERQLELALWCTHAVADEPARVDVRLNDVPLAPGGLALGREPALVHVRAPETAWRRGANELT